MNYLPPARIGDFDRSQNKDALYDAWHQQVKSVIDRYRHLPRFLDPLEAGDMAIRDSFPWTGFPRIFDAWLDIENRPEAIDRAHRSAELLRPYAYAYFEGEFRQVPADFAAGWFLVPQVDGAPAFDDAFALSERPQDEYLEWHVVRDPATRKVLRIDYTVEAPEYWETLAKGDRTLTGELYSELLKTQVPEEDLFFAHDILCPELERTQNGFSVKGFVPLGERFQAGAYNDLNVWNTRKGAVHLTQRNNTLFAEIALAADATQRFALRPDVSTHADRFALIACGGFGAVNRNSDPTIGRSVNTLALSGYKAMVSNPIGLYVGEVDVTSFRDPDGHPVPRDRILTVHRGTFQDEDGLPRVLRYSIHPPEGVGYTLDQCSFDGYPLTTGGPVARKTTVTIHGIAEESDTDNPVKTCVGQVYEHPTKRPKYFEVVAANAACPLSDDRVWHEAPIPLAPDAPRPPVHEGPRGLSHRT